MRILMVTPASPLVDGGVERHVLEVSRRLVAGGDSVDVVCADPGGPGLVEFSRDGVEFHVVRAWPANQDWRFAPGIWRQMSRGHWDVVHIQCYHTFVAPIGMVRALRLGIPYVVTFHGGGHSSRLRERLRGVHRRALKPLLIRAQRLIAVARFEIDFYGRELGIPQEKFTLIRNGTELTAFLDVQHGGDDDRTTVEPPPVIVSVGRLVKYKGHHRVIAAMPYVLASRPDARLKIVGTGPYEGELRRQAADLDLGDRIEFTSVPPGDPRGMAELLRGTRLSVLLSDFETQPQTALEAVASGRRLLVADRGGTLELAEDGLARAISPEAPPDLVATAILEELVLPLPVDAARQLTTWEDCVAKLGALYRSVA